MSFFFCSYLFSLFIFALNLSTPAGWREKILVSALAVESDLGNFFAELCSAEVRAFEGEAAAHEEADDEEDRYEFDKEDRKDHHYCYRHCELLSALGFNTEVVSESLGDLVL